MEKSTGKIRIVWAIDVLSEKRSSVVKTAQVIREMTAGLDSMVQPLFVISPDEFEVMDPELYPEWKEEKSIRIKKMFHSLLKGIDLAGLEDPRVETTHETKVTAQVTTLAAHAKSLDADLIVTRSHARSGVSRLFLGSFAETLLLHSEIPVFVINPKTKSAGKIKKILFPTDFSGSSFRAFLKLISFASQTKAKITLFHEVVNPVEPVLGPGVVILGGNRISVKEFLRKEKVLKKDRAQGWIDAAKKFGVDVRFVVNSSNRSIDAAIIDFAKKQRFSAIAMTANKGAVGAALLGSVARSVVRSSECPVWVLHEEHSSDASIWNIVRPDEISILTGNLII